MDVFRYICWSGDFELAGPGETETPLQKYHRLNFEVRELMEELEESQKKTSGASEGLSGVGALASVAAKVRTRLICKTQCMNMIYE